MQIIIVIFMYLGFIQSPDQFNNPMVQRRYANEINQVNAQVNGFAKGSIGQPGDLYSVAVNVDGTPVIIDIQQF